MIIRFNSWVRLTSLKDYCITLLDKHTLHLPVLVNVNGIVTLLYEGTYNLTVALVDDYRSVSLLF
jgi:hypothetical protein